MARPSKNRTARLVLSMDPTTKERLQAYAEQNHTNISQAITDWIWKQPVMSGSQAQCGYALNPGPAPGAMPEARTDNAPAPEEGA